MTAHRKIARGRPRVRDQRGFTLLEVMVAAVILVIVVLGAAAMTIAAIRDSHQSELRSTAVGLAYEVGDMMRAYPAQVNRFIGAQAGANPGTVNNNCYNLSIGCTESSLSRADLYEWARKFRDPRNLPGGNAVICRDTANAVPSTPTSPNCDNQATSPIVVKV